MEALYKMVASFLSVALIFTSVAPSFAQIRNTSRSRNSSVYTAPNESTRTAFSAQVERSMLVQVQENTSKAVDKEQATALQEMQKIVFSAKFSQPEQAQENVDLKTLFPKEDFVRLYKNINQKVLNETLAKCTTEEDRAYVQEQWKKKTSSNALQSKYNQALANLQQEINQEAKAHLRYLSEQAVTLLGDSFKVNGQVIDIDPVAQFLPLMVPFGEEVLPKMVRTKATVILRKRLQNSAVKACKDETSCKRMLQNAAALAVLGTQQKDVETVAKVLKANHNGPAGASVISVLGPLLLAMNDIDPQYRAFSDMMSRIAEEEGHVNSWDIVGGAMSLETQLTAAHYMGAGTFALGYENSFYKADNQYKNLYNAWIDFGQAVAQESASNRALKNVMNNLLGGQLVGLQTAPKGHQQVVIKHPLFVTGLLSAGYQLDIKGKHAQTYLDAQGRAHQTADTRADWTKFNQGLKAANLTQSEGVALLLFKAGKANIDPYTVVYIGNQLAGAYKRSERTAQSVGMQKRTHPSAQEKSSYENWKTAQGVAGALDAVITVAAMVVLLRAVLTALPKIAGSGAQTMRSIMKAARIARGGQAANISRLSSMQKVLRTAHYYKYGTYSRGSAFLQKARTSLGASLGYRINMNELMPQKATYVRPTTTKPIQYTQVDMGVQNGQRTVAIATTPEQEAALMAQRTSIAPQTFTSQGAPVANTSKVQPVMAQTTETVAAPAASNTATAPKVTPKWIWGESTNTLGQTVPSMVPNPAHPEYVQMLAAQSGKVSRQFSWKNLWTDMQLVWQLNKPTFSQLLKFGTSRYGLAAAGPGAAPISSEAAIAQAADMPAVVQTVRTQQGMFIAEEFLRGGAGASYRIGAVNPGALAVPQRVKTAATVVQLNPAFPFMKAAASVALTVGGGYTAAQMGLLPTDGSNLVSLAMLPGLVVTPDVVKPLLQMAFNGPGGGNGGRLGKRPRIHGTVLGPAARAAQKTAGNKATAAVASVSAPAPVQVVQVANGAEVVVNTPQTAPVQAHVSQVASGMAVTKPSQTASVVPLQNLASFTFKKSAEDLDDDEVEQLFKKFIENSTRIGFERYVDSSEENNAFLIIQTAAMQSVEDEDFSNEKVTEILNRWQQVMPLLGSQQDGSFNKLKYNERLGMKSSVKDIKINQFHIVHEIKKIPVTNTLPQTLASHIVVNKTADGFVESVKLKQGVTSGEIDAILTVLLPQGYTFRMGKHEFRNGNNPMLRNNQYQLHIHFEKIGEAKANTWAVDTNYVLNIDTKDLIQSAGTRLNDKKIADIYKDLFEKYLPKAWQTDYSGYIQSNFM